MYTLGKVLYDKEKLVIPFPNIFATLFGNIIPIIIGIIIQKKCPRLSNLWIKVVPYIMVVFLIFCLSVGTYAYWYMFLLVDLPIIIGSASIPYLGFIFGGLLAVVLRQKKENVVAIAVETGIQNTGIPVLILQSSLSGAHKYTSIIAPVMSASFTPLPLAVVSLSLFIKQRNHKKAAEYCTADVEDRKGLRDVDINIVEFQDESPEGVDISIVEFKDKSSKCSSPDSKDT